MHQIQRVIARATMILGVVWGLVACGSETGSPAPTSNEPTTTAAGTFSSSSGICKRSATYLRTWQSPSASDHPCSDNTYGGRAIGAGARLLGDIVEVDLADTGDLAAVGGTLEQSLVNVDLRGVADADVAKVQASGMGDASDATAEVTRLRVHLAGIAISADVIDSHAHGLCTSEREASYSGTSTIANLYIDGVHVDVDATPNRALDIRGILRIVLDEQRRDANGFTVAALHISVLSLISAADVVIAKATTSIVCNACPPPPGDDDDDDISPPTGDDDDDDDDDCYGDEPRPTPTGGGAGASCDESNPCAPGYACANDTPLVVK